MVGGGTEGGKEAVVEAVGKSITSVQCAGLFKRCCNRNEYEWWATLVARGRRLCHTLTIHFSRALVVFAL